MKLSYWYAPRIDDSDAYSIRARTKKQALEDLEDAYGQFGSVRKVTVEYQDGFDLMMQCMSEGRGYWEIFSQAPLLDRISDKIQG
jgi:hypothetical protein